MNQFTYFFTWTLNSALINRYDPDEVKKKVTNTLKHLSQRKGFLYVCVPEHHRDGAIHFHGLCIPGDVTLVRAERLNHPVSTNRGQPVYNMQDWTWGFSTCIPIDENYDRTVNYLLKYITKDSEKILGKWYYSSRYLRKKPEISLCDGVDYDEFHAEHNDAYEVMVYRDIKMCLLDIPIVGGDDCV